MANDIVTTGGVSRDTLELAKALAKAQRACKAAPHDRRNEFHKYDYTSSEAIIGAAKDALSAAGLALIPVEQTLNGYDKEGENRFELCRKFLLVYPNGDTYPIVVNWPVVPDRGRPLDKAVASAATTSLAYLLRDLLLMPRVDPADDLTGRAEPPAPAPKPAPAPRKPPAKKATDKPTPPKTTEEMIDRLKAKDDWLSKQGKIEPGQLIAYVREAVADPKAMGKTLEEAGIAAYPLISNVVKDYINELNAGQPAA